MRFVLFGDILVIKFKHFIPNNENLKPTGRQATVRLASFSTLIRLYRLKMVVN